MTASSWGRGSSNAVRSANIGRSETDSGRGTVISNPMVYGSSRNDSHSQGYSPFGPTGVPPHLRNWISPPVITQGSQSTSAYQPRQAGQPTGWGSRTTASSSQHLASGSNPKQTSDAGLRERAAALANEAPEGWKTASNRRDPKKENRSKWYKGVSITRGFLLAR